MLSTKRPLKNLLLIILAAILICVAGAKLIHHFGGRPSGAVIIDFENETEMDRLVWKCHDAFELTKGISGEGHHALLADLEPAKYPGVQIFDVPRNWEGFSTFEFYFSAPSSVGQKLHIRIDDSDIADDYHARYQGQILIGKGVQKVSIPLETIRTQPAKRHLNLRTIERIVIYLYNQKTRSTLTLDDLRLR